VGRPATWLFAVLSGSLVAFGWVADRGLRGEVRQARREARDAAAETARLAARSLGAALLSLERVVVSGRDLPGVDVEWLAEVPPHARVPGAGEVPYGRRPRSWLIERLDSTLFTPSGLPEAVVARLALGDAAAVTLPGGEVPPDVGERLLSGELPVRPEDLPTLARALGVGADPRVETLRARLLAAPSARDLPDAPAFRRRLDIRPNPQPKAVALVEGWTLLHRPREGLGRRVRYEAPLSGVVEAAHLPDEVEVAAGRPVAPGLASAEVEELPGLPVVARERQGGVLRVRALRVGLWLAVSASIGLLVAVRRALAAQARAMAREKTFLSSVTHELRTPLAALRLFGERLALGLGNPSEYGAIIAEESERLESLVERVLAATRASERPAFAPVEPAELVRSALALVGPRAERRGVTVTCRASRPLPAAAWDAEAVRRALLNLLDNAIRHGREGGRVDISSFKEGDAVCLSVADDGPGIARREQREVFGRFVRGRTDAPGTGLGLHVVEQVAHAHGGRVDLVSEEGRGCVFTLRLPIAPPGAAPPPHDETLP
jgi:signal transduction histidine kinase